MPKTDTHTEEPKAETPEQIVAKLAHQQRHLHTSESNAYLEGLFEEFQAQLGRYHDLTTHHREIEARVELTEKTLSLTRDHLAEMIEKVEFATPRDWTKSLNQVRYVGVRLVDACTELLRERGRMTVAELVAALNERMFRFRTNSPPREIHAAVLRQRHTIRKTADGWEWIGPREPRKSKNRLKLVKQSSPERTKIET